MSGPAFQVDRPDDIPMRMTLCMSLGRWREVKAAIEKSGLPTHYGALGEVCAAINSMVSQAERHWEPERAEK